MSVHPGSKAAADASGATGSAPANTAGELFGHLISHLATANVLAGELRDTGFKVEFSVYEHKNLAVSVEVTGPRRPSPADGAQAPSTDASNKPGMNP